MKTTLLNTLLLLFPFHLFAQTFTGQVRNQQKEPIFGAHVLNLSNGIHTHSDHMGNFMLEKASVGDTLHFSHIGYVLRDVVIQDLVKPLNITLKTQIIALDAVVIAPKLNALNVVTDIDLQTKPVTSSQEILRQVPGLFIGQHAGGGKAEQIFLRGFDVDHGTDVTLTADGLPINMVSHAHGQGYADLHFIIPETVDAIDFGKGPYYADKGNFNTAGYVHFKTKPSLDNSLIQLETGQFNSHRLLGMFQLLNQENHNSYLATEYLMSDGPFESPQNFHRFNVMGKYTGKVSESDELGISLSYFTSKWDASGQIPQRAIDDGSISRFGAIDDTEGGQTSRLNAAIHYNKFLSPSSWINNTLFYSYYDFELYSNFTFFLEDPINGDQIKQQEHRNIFGLNSEYNQSFTLGNLFGTIQAGIQLRTDQSKDNELAHTLNRKTTLNQIQLGNIQETNIGAYLNTNFHLGNWTINPALRVDIFDFQYNDALLTAYQTQTTSPTIVSPKLNILYNHSPYLQFYVKSGKGFHANDTRVAVAQNGRNVLPAAYGTDAGFIWKPFPRLLVNTAYWYLFLEQEFVYVGDAGIVEPSGKTRRQGVDLSIRYQLLDWLYGNLDANYTHARAIDEEVGSNYIPLAPDFTLTGGINALHPSGLYGGLHVRHLNDRPANEDNSIVAKGYTIVDANLGYNWKRLNFGVQIQNLFNTKWKETQFATESRLQEEGESVEEIHFTPGTPFFVKGVLGYKF